MFWKEISNKSNVLLSHLSEREGEKTINVVNSSKLKLTFPSYWQHTLLSSGGTCSSHILNMAVKKKKTPNHFKQQFNLQ